ncbi:MAG: hypothetical protein M0036_05055 [Desulfobacteraceae bacterium]|nr:hypothetical protein [Desulfobacteraceae bacterium]
MQNPCRCCPIHKRREDKKDSDTCRRCKKRQEYVAAIGGMFTSVPDGMCDFRRFVKGEKYAGNHH